MEEEEKVKREIWLTEFNVHVVEITGCDWPDVILERWERNLLGEVRFVDSRIVPNAYFQRSEQMESC